MKLTPGKIYKIKKDMWFYDHDSGGKYDCGTSVMYLGIEREWGDPDDVLHVYFLIGHEKLHFDSYNIGSFPEDYDSKYFEELS